jgi:hypothetical protein
MDDYSQMATSTWVQMQNQFTLYQTSAIILFIVIVGIVILFRPAFPFIWSRFITHETVVGLLDKNRNIIPTLGFKLVNGMWYYKDKPLPFVKNYPGRYFFAGIPFQVLVVDLAMINDPIYNRYVNELKRLGYPNIDALETAILFSQIKDSTDLRIEDILTRKGYATYEEAKQRINPEGLTVDHYLVKPFFSSIPLNELLGYGADIPTENIHGEVDDRFEAMKPNAMALKKVKEMLPWCLIMIAASVLIVVLYKIFFSK